MEREYQYLKALAVRNNYFGLLCAMKVTEQEGAENTWAQGVMTAYQLSILGLDEEPMLASALLHGTFGDDPIAIQKLLRELQDPAIIGHMLTLMKNERGPWVRYFEKIKQDPISLLVKLANRALGLSEIIVNYPYAKIWLYVLETEEYILPLCTYGSEHYPKYERQFLVLENQISILCNVLRIFIEKAEGG